MPKNNNLPARLENYTASAMVNVPLNELDNLRAALVQANNEITEFKNNQAQVKVTLEQTVIRETQKYSHFSGYTTKRDKELLNHSMFINMDELITTLKQRYDEKEADIVHKADIKVIDAAERYKQESENAIKEEVDAYSALKKDLHKKYNGDKINLLESELEHLEAILTDRLESLNIAEGLVETLQNQVDEYKFGHDTLMDIKSEYVQFNSANVFEKFLKGMFVKIDNLLSKSL